MNLISIAFDRLNFVIDAAKPLSIAVPLRFNGEQPNAYAVEKASAAAYTAGEIVGDTRRGGSCNFEQIKMIPHCNGTHTECVGHITDDRISVNDCLRDAFIPSILISVKPQSAANSNKTYAVETEATDELITRRAIENAFANHSLKTFEGLIIRTLPNDQSKQSRRYADKIPPFFTTEAMNFIVSRKIKHLLVDTPSIDRIYDQGKLSNHRIFWNVSENSREITEKSLINHTITELIYVNNEIEDGAYLLNLQIAPFAADAAPSRPLLFKIEN